MNTNSILIRADNKAIGSTPARRRRTGKGYKLRDEAPRAPSVHVLLTDAQVLECRTRFEHERGWTMQTLAIEYGTSREYMRRLLEYQTRSKLIPKHPK
jgi:hypothetical protein